MKSSSSDLEAAEAALNWAVGRGVTDRVMQDLTVEMRRVRLRKGAAMGGIAAGLIVGVVWFFAVSEDSNAELSSPIVTRSSAVVSLPAKRILSDGSVVELKNGADIAIDFSDAVRRVSLLRGEAHFEVVKNTQRPFVVVAGGIQAQAVGTAFSVQLSGGSVEILVTEGRVSVEKQMEVVRSATIFPGFATSAASPSLAPLALVDAGNSIVVELSGDSSGPQSIQPVSRLEMDEKLSWRVPRLEFSGTPLADVIELFNQHGRAQISLSDSALGSLQISGVLRADNIDALLQLLAIQFGIRADRRGETGIVLLFAGQKTK